MKPESLQAFTQLQSFGMEELSSEEAAELLSVIHECPECEGEWVLFQETISTLSHTAIGEVTSECSKQMWLVCLEHAKEKHTYSIDGNGATATPELELAGQKKNTQWLNDGLSDNSGLEKTCGTPLSQTHPHLYFASRTAVGMATASLALLAATYFFVPQKTQHAAMATLPATLVRTTPAGATGLSPEDAQLAAYVAHSNLYTEPLSDSVTPQIISYSMNAGSR